MGGSKPRRKTPRLTLRKRTKFKQKLKTEKQEVIPAFNELQANVFNELQANENLEEPEADFDEIDIRSCKIILRRVDENDKFKELIRQYHERIAPPLPPPPPVVSNEEYELDTNQDTSDFTDSDSDEDTKDLQNRTVAIKPIKCSYCSRFFTNTTLLEQHEAFHAKPKTLNQKKNFTSFSTRILGTYKKSSHNSKKSVSLDHVVLDPETHKLRRKMAVAKKHIYPPPRRELIQDGVVGITVPEVVYVNSNLRDTEYLISNIHNTEDEGMIPIPVDPLQDQDPLMETGNDSLVQKSETYAGARTSIIGENGVQCDLSDMGSLVDLLDGTADVNIRTPQGQNSETLTLNYQKNDIDISNSCRICKHVCKGIFGLQNHMYRIHNLFICSTCHHCSKTAQGIREHIEKMHIQSHLYCKPCKKLFVNTTLKKNHEKGSLHKQRIQMKHISEVSSDLDINTCSTETETEPKPQSHVCQLCPRKFAKKKDRDNHITGTHGSCSSVTCHICYEVHKNKALLTRHKKAAHFAVLRLPSERIACKYCGQVFEQQVELWKHEGIHYDEHEPRSIPNTEIFTDRRNKTFLNKSSGRVEVDPVNAMIPLEAMVKTEVDLTTYVIKTE